MTRMKPLKLDIAAAATEADPSHSKTRCPQCGHTRWESWSCAVGMNDWIMCSGRRPWFEVLRYRARPQWVFIDICVNCGLVAT
jgi:hypothetical protein